MIKKLCTLLALALCLNGKAQCPVSIDGAPTGIFNVPFCGAGSSSTFTATGATTYSWAPAIGLSNTTGAIVTITPTVNTTYTITGTTGTCVATNIFSVTVNPLPSAPALSGSNPVTACQGTPITLSVTPTGTVACQAPQWYVGSSYSYTGYHRTFSNNVVGTTVYSVYDSSNAGCFSSSLLTITVTVNAAPAPPTLVAPTQSVNVRCQSSSDTLYTNIPASGDYHCWYNGNNHIGATGPYGRYYIIYPIPTPGTYVYNIKDSSSLSGCTSSLISTTVIINSTPSMSFTIVADASPHTWDLYPSITGGTPPYNYEWSWGDGSTNSTGATPSHTYSVAGNYWISVTITDANGCSNFYYQNDSLYRTASGNMVYVNVLNPATGINQITSTNELNIYPNPNNGSFVIEPQNTLYNVHCTVYDVNGKMVLSQTINGKTSIDAGSLNEGVYNISLQSNEGVVNKRVVIVR